MWSIKYYSMPWENAREERKQSFLKHCNTTSSPKHSLVRGEAFLGHTVQSQPRHQLPIPKAERCSPFVPIQSWSCSSLKVSLTLPPDLLYMPDSGTVGSRSCNETQPVTPGLGRKHKLSELSAFSAKGPPILPAFCHKSNEPLNQWEGSQTTEKSLSDSECLKALVTHLHAFDRRHHVVRFSFVQHFSVLLQHKNRN